MAQFRAQAGQEYINPVTGQKVSYTAEQLNDPAIGQLSEQFIPNIIRNQSNNLVGGSSQVTNQSNQLKNDYAELIKSQQQPSETITDLESQAQSLRNLQSNVATTTSADEQRVKQAGLDAASQYDYLLSQAKKERGRGLGQAEVSAGEAGGFMNTQFVGMAGETGITPEMAATMGRYGAGGELSRIKSDYDASINNLETQRLAAISKAEESMRNFIRTGKQDEYDNAYKAFQAAKDAAKAKTDEANAMADRLMKVNQYNLDVDKFQYQQYNDNLKNQIESSKLDLDIAKVTGLWNGAPTLEAKKQAVDEAYKKMGYDLDEKKFNWQMTSDQLKQDLENKKYDLDKSKFDAEKNGEDVNGTVESVMNGTMTYDDALKSMKYGKQAFLQGIAKQKSVLQDAYKETDNVSYLLKSTSGGKQIVSTDQQMLGKVWSVMGQLDQVKAAFDEADKKGKTGAFAGRITDAKFWDQDKAKIDAALASVVPTVARGIFGEVGVLTDNDINNYKKAIASVKTPNEARDVIFRSLLTNVAAKATETLRSNANAKYDVSGYAYDYEKMVNNVANKLGGQKLKSSTNPAVYDNVEQYLSSVDQNTADQFQNMAIKQMKAAGITDINDYFQALKEAQMSRDILKETQNFNNVGGDTNKASSKIIDTKIGNKTIKVSQSIADKIAKADADYFKDTGKHLQINQSYRTPEEQEKLYKELSPKGARVAKPGTSFHEKGLAIDVTNWKNAEKYLRKYGLRNDLQDDKGHFSWGETA